MDGAGVLDKGDEAIADARRRYKQIYSAKWRKNQRKVTKQFTIAFTPIEAKDLLEAAKKHKRSRTRFIKDSCLAYMNKRYLVPDVLAIRSIEQALVMIYNILKKLSDETSLPFQIGTDLLKQMSDLEHKVLVELHNPKTLEKWVVESITMKPEYKTDLIDFIQNLQV